MSPIENPVFFSCRHEQLLGIYHEPESPSPFGVVIVVGGPQYRVGSHRQFVLLARRLSNAGISVFRFDYRGMGDSGGETVGFEAIKPDIEAAIDTFFLQAPFLKKVVLWGLCDAASSILLYAAHRDQRVVGQILLNPWVRTDEGIAKVYLKSYYGRRLFDKELWQKIFGNTINYQDAWTGIFSSFKKIFEGGIRGKSGKYGQKLHYIERMLTGMEVFQGSTLVILSGNDLTADEFRQLVAGSERWKAALKPEQVKTVNLSEANHTFSKSIWRDQVADLCIDWVKTL